MAHKFEPLDVMSLFKDYTDQQFCEFLMRKIEAKDLSSLIKCRYGLQSGMARISNKSICHDEHVNTYIRWIKYIENGIKLLWRRMYPNPLDNPHNKNNPTIDMNACLKHKRDRDKSLAELLKKNSY